MSCLLRSLAHYLTVLLGFVFLIFESFLYILGNSPLSDSSFGDNFPQSWCFFLLVVSFMEKKILMSFSLHSISFMHY